MGSVIQGRHRKLVLPDDVTEVIIVADHDDPGIAAANKTARRWTAEGRMVRIAKPPIEGWDFNDMLSGVSHRIGKGTV